MYLPEAFQKKMKAILGEEYDDFLAGFEKPRHYGLRVNTAKITVEEFKELVPFHLTQIPWAKPIPRLGGGGGSPPRAKLLSVLKKFNRRGKLPLRVSSKIYHLDLTVIIKPSTLFPEIS